MNKAELLPCPFCGGEAEVRKLDLGAIDEGWQLYGVWCIDDLHAEEHGGYCHGHFIDNYASEAEAIEAWNTRAERTCRWTGSVGLGFADGAYDEESDTYHAVPVVCHHFDCGHGTITEGYEIPAFCPVCGAKVENERTPND